MLEQVVRTGGCLLVGAVLAAAACAPLEQPAAPAPRGQAAGRGPGVWRGSGDIVRAPARPPRGSDAGRVNALSRAILYQVNLERRREGRQALLPDDRLGRAAQSYARELAGRGRLDHTSPVPGRHTFMDRLAAEGARPRMAGENLALLTETPRALPAHVVQLWLDSPGHRANLLEPRFTCTGIGVWPGSDGVWYVTEEYSSRP